MSKYISSIIRTPGSIELFEADMPNPGLGQALVKVHYAAICGTDMHIYEDKYPAQLPKVVGHECAGEIVKLNPIGSTHLNTGDMVAVQPFLSCGICDACVTGHGNACVEQKFFGTKTDGCFSQYILAPLEKICKVNPDNVSMKLAAMTEPLAVGVHAVRESGFMVGETALIMGAGPIGLMLALVLRMAGATNIVLTEMMDYRIKFARSMGFTVVNASESDLAKRLIEINRGDRYHKVFEATAVSDSYKLMFDTVKARGIIMLLGLTSQQHPFNTTQAVFQEAQVRALRIHSMESFRYAIRILETGVLGADIDKIMTHEFPFDEIQRAMEFAIEDKEHIKVVIKM